VTALLEYLNPTYVAESGLANATPAEQWVPVLLSVDGHLDPLLGHGGI